MRNYWFKIVLGALAVFAVGMALRAAFLSTRARVKAIAGSSVPISIPLAFVPFRLDGDRLGTFDRAVLIRKSPRQVSGLRLGVKLSDSAAAARLSGCDLLAKFGPERGGSGAEFSDANFACVKGDSVVAHGAERFGEVGFEPGSFSVALYVPAEVARNLRHEMVQNVDIRAEVAADSIAARFGDSVARVHQLRGDSLREAAMRTADSARARALHLRDSLRAASRR